MTKYQPHFKQFSKPCFMGFARQVAIDTDQNHCPSQSQLTTRQGRLRHLLVHRHCTLEHCPFTWNGFNCSNPQYKAVRPRLHNTAYRAFSPFGVGQAWAALGKSMLAVPTHLLVHCVFGCIFQEILLSLLSWKLRLGWLLCCSSDAPSCPCEGEMWCLPYSRHQELPLSARTFWRW